MGKIFRIVFFGDSLTRRSIVNESINPQKKFWLDYTGSYADILMKKLIVNYPEIRFEYFNKGIGGNTVANLLKRVAKDVLSLSPDLVILFIGQNDAKHFTTVEYKNKLIKLLGILKKNNIYSMQLSTTPSPGEDEKNVILNSYDIVIKELCSVYKNTYIDVKKHFDKVLKQNETINMPIVLFNQGCHMSELGNILLADRVFETFKQDKKFCTFNQDELAGKQ